MKCIVSGLCPKAHCYFKSVPEASPRWRQWDVTGPSRPRCCAWTHLQSKSALEACGPCPHPEKPGRSRRTWLLRRFRCKKLLF